MKGATVDELKDIFDATIHEAESNINLSIRLRHTIHQRNYEAALEGLREWQVIEQRKLDELRIQRARLDD